MKRMTITASAREELAGDGMCVGAASQGRSGKPCITKHTVIDESLIVGLTVLLKSLSTWPSECMMYIIQINTGSTGWHCDKGNVGPSVALSVGNFVGGALLINDRCITTWISPAVFNCHEWYFLHNHMKVRGLPLLHLRMG